LEKDRHTCQTRMKRKETESRKQNNCPRGDSALFRIRFKLLSLHVKGLNVKNKRGRRPNPLLKKGGVMVAGFGSW